LHFGEGAVPTLLQAIKKDPGEILFPIFGFCAIAFMAAQVVNLNNGGTPLTLAIVVALAVSATLWFIPRRTFVRLFVNTFGWLPVTLGSLSYFFWYWYAELYNTSIIQSDFFLASSGVLPVLLLAAIVDVRRSETLKSKDLVLPIIAVFLGEVAALNALAFGQASPEDFAAVASSLVSTTIALVLAVMADHPREEEGKGAISQAETSPHLMPAEIAAKECEPADDNEQARPIR
jgi:hypothetical protein